MTRRRSIPRKTTSTIPERRLKQNRRPSRRSSNRSPHSSNRVAQTVQSKDQLLAETNAKESTYEQLLANAEAQIKGFTTFAQEAGGAALVGNQTICDSWGCYYNQRDSAWGSASLDGTQYTLADAGCLVASMAMIMTHYGYRTVTPVTINSNSDNFAAYYPASLLATIVVDGVTVSRKAAAIDATLATGNPVVVGLERLRRHALRRLRKR